MLAVNFVKNCLLHCLLSVEVQHPPSAIFDLHPPHTSAADVLLKSVVEPAPEGFVLFSFNNCKDIAFGGVVLPFLRRFETIGQVLPLVMLPMLSEIVTLLLTEQHA